MKILVISHMYPSTFNEINGIFVHQQVKELTKQGCKMKVISPIAWTPFPIKYLRKKWKAYSKIPKRINWDGVEVCYPRYVEFPKALFFASSGDRMYWGIKETVDKIYQEFSFDLIHAHVVLPDGWAGMKVAKKYKKLALLVKPKDVDSLVKAIDFLLSHLGEAKKIGERARKLVLENYTWEKNAEKTIRIYKEVFGAR